MSWIYKDTNCFYTEECVNISSLALIKMLKHSKAGIPIEVMGLLLGDFIDENNISIKDVFAMPQMGTGVSVESIDPAFQTKMLDLLSQVGNKNIIVGWYHSHPGFGCWLSGVDINTQQSFENLNKRSVAIVIDPIQSFKNRVCIEAYRLYPPSQKTKFIRETVSLISMMDTKTFQKDDQGLNKYYYSLRISIIKNIIEELLFISMFKNNVDVRLIEKNVSKENIELLIIDTIIRSIFKIRMIINYTKTSDKNVYLSLLETVHKARNLVSKNLINIGTKITTIF